MFSVFYRFADIADVAFKKSASGNFYFAIWYYFLGQEALPK
jgi:hypothetical protein